jgi:hypothetical protein
MVEPHHYLEITELAELIAVRDISPVEATRTQLDRIVALMASCIAMPSLHPSSGRPTRTISCLKCSRRPESSNLARRANPRYNTPRGLSALPVGFRASIILAVSHAKFCHLMGRSLENRIT